MSDVSSWIAKVPGLPSRALIPTKQWEEDKPLACSQTASSGKAGGVLGFSTCKEGCGASSGRSSGGYKRRGSARTPLASQKKKQRVLGSLNSSSHLCPLVRVSSPL
ncbi:unnamed protein product [Lepidochelys olivacea]